MKTIAKLTAIAFIAATVVALLPETARAGDFSFSYNSSNRGNSRNYRRDECAPLPTRPGAYGVVVRYTAPQPRYVTVTRWVPGHYEIRTDQVYIEGSYRTVDTPAAYDWVWDGYRWVWQMVRPPRCERVYVPGRYETRQVQVWIEGRYVQDAACNY